MADALDLLLVHQFGHALLQCLFVALVRQLVDDDGLALAFVDVFEMHLRAHHHTTPPGPVAVFHAIDAVNDTGRREVWCGDDFHQFVNRCGWVAQQMQASINRLIQIVRRDIRRHANGDARGTVDQQIGEARRHHQRLSLAAIVIRTEVDGFLVQIRQQLVRDLGHADFCVTHRGRVVAVHRAEVALAIHQHMTQ